MQEGYIKLARSSIDDPMYLADEFSRWQAWCDLLMLAHPEDTEIVVRGISIEAHRGCVYISTRTLAERWKWTRWKVMRFLNELINENKISRPQFQPQNQPQSRPQNKIVIDCYSIVKYDEYYTIPTIKPTITPTTKPTIAKEKRKVAKEIKKEDLKESIISIIDKKNGEKSSGTLFKGYESYDLSFIDDMMKEPLSDYLAYRRERGDKKFTQRGLEGLYKKLFKFSYGNPDTAREIIEQSIANNWMGIFPIKNYGTGQTNNNTATSASRLSKLADILTG